MKKKFLVWMSQGYSNIIEAKEVKVVSINDKPIKIKFLIDDDCPVAEFYCGMICGWAEVNRVEGYNKNN